MDIAFFRTHSLTKGLSSAELQRLNGMLEEKQFAEGEQLCVEGTLQGGLLLLREGTVTVTKKSGATQTVLAQLEAPTVLGELELVSNEPSAATVVASKPVTAYVLTSGAFEHLVDEGDSAVSKIMRNIARVVVHRLMETNNRLANILDPVKLEQLAQVQKELSVDWG